jgi:hypothetical protein
MLSRWAFAASGATLAFAAQAYTPHEKQAMAAFTDKIVATSQAKCDPATDSKGSLANRDLRTLLGMQDYLKAYPENATFVFKALQFLAANDMAVCFDERMSSLPYYGVAVHGGAQTIGINSRHLAPQQARGQTQEDILRGAEYTSGMQVDLLMMRSDPYVDPALREKAAREYLATPLLIPRDFSLDSPAEAERTAMTERLKQAPVRAARLR